MKQQSLEIINWLMVGTVEFDLPMEELVSISLEKISQIEGREVTLYEIILMLFDDLTTSMAKPPIEKVDPIVQTLEEKLDPESISKIFDFKRMLGMH